LLNLADVAKKIYKKKKLKQTNASAPLIPYFDNIALKYGDITIFKMVIVRHLVFPNLKNFHILASFIF